MGQPAECVWPAEVRMLGTEPTPRDLQLPEAKAADGERLQEQGCCAISAF
jgi:hypothetical protein